MSIYEDECGDNNQDSRYDEFLVFSYVVDKNIYNICKKIPYGRHNDAPEGSTHGAVQEKSPFSYVGTSKQQEDNASYANKEPDEKYNEITIPFHDSVGKGNLASEEFISVDDVSPEGLAEEEKGTVAGKGS